MLAAFLAGGLGLGCGDSGPEPSSEDWPCTAERDLFERCDDGTVVWCHAVGEPHFHSGARCEAANLDCIEVDERRAVCADPASTCEAEAFRCDGNTALNCVAGLLSQEPCGTRKTCLAEAEAGVAVCRDPRPEAPCSGLGDLYESGCVCLRGYRATADGACVPDA
jgi:hypothetical protein